MKVGGWKLPLIVCYHAISPSWPSPLAVTPQALRRHMSILHERGYTGMTMTECERRRHEGTLPDRTVVITFDDAYRSAEAAVPILDAVGYPATIFVVSEFVESRSPLRWDGIERWAWSPHAEELESLGWEQLASMVSRGWEIGSHTASHALLPRLGDGLLEEELGLSRALIERRLGSCHSIAYPYGQADARVAAAAAAAGYSVGCTLTAAHRVDEPLRRPRIGMYHADVGWRAHVKLSPVTVGLRRTLSAAWPAVASARTLLRSGLRPRDPQHRGAE